MRQASHSQRYRFGEFLLDPTSRELRRENELLTVSPKVFDCIVYLIEHRRRAVGHDELIAAVWGDVNVAEVQLRHLVRKVRHVVDANATDQSSIRTIPRFGYRWVAPLADDNGPSVDSLPVPRISSISANPRPAVSPKTGAIMALSIVVLAIVLFRFGGSASDSAEKDVLNKSRDQANAVAILPVESEDFNDDDAWMRLGLMDLMAKHLRQAGVEVVPSSDIVSLEGSDLSGTTLAEKTREASGAPNIVEPKISHQAGGWILRVEWRGRGSAASTIQTQSVDAVMAAREASDKLLLLLGRHLVSDTSSKTPPEVSQLQQRVEAAWLVGNIDRARHVLEGASSAAKANSETQLLQAKIDLAAGESSAVDERLQKMLDELSQEADPLLRARILSGLGAAERQTGKWDLARQRFDESIRLLENLDQPSVLGHAYVGRAAIASLQAHYDDAQADFSRARIAFELAGDPLEVARAEANEGVLEAMRSHPSQALNLLSHAARRLEQFGDRSWLMNTLANIISAQLDLLRPADAFNTSEQMKQELPAMESSMHARIAHVQQVPALLRSGHIRDTWALMEKLQRVESAHQDRGTLGLIHGYKAEFAIDGGDWQAALDNAEVAVSQLAELEDEDAKGSAWLIKIRALRGLGREQEAAIETQKFSTWSHERETPRRSLRGALAQAEQAWAEQRLQPAAELYEIALHIAHERGVPADVAEVAISYGNALLSAGDLSRATTVIGQVSPWMETDFDCALLQARLYKKLRRNELWRAALANARLLAVERPIPADVAEQAAVSAPVAALR